MGVEIERKFLVQGDTWRSADAVYYCQGYLNSDKQRTVRVRVAGESGYITIKGQTQGATRVEYEYQIPLAEAKELLTLCEGPLIEKYRRKIACENFIWEVDEFLGDNLGLVVAEIELKSEHQPFTRPDWIAQEVTQDARYYNSNLVKNPYLTW